MSDSGSRGGGYFWCLNHKRVESGDEVCPVKYRIGPFPSHAEATRALDTVEKRNEAWDAEDARWTGEGS